MRFILSSLLIINTNAYCQQIENLGLLPEEIQESSGLIYINNSLFSHNDSGGSPIIHELNQNSLHVERSIYVENAINVDWEDLATDDTYLYIGDFGNNNGNRENLRILRIQIDELIEFDTVSYELIEFSYEDQTDFESQPFNTNFDCEAMIAFGDSLILFTKNWADLKTNIYSLPKEQGSWVAARRGGADVSTLITGADYNQNTNELALIGYEFGQALLIKSIISGNQNWDELSFVSEELVLSNSYQIEGVAYLNDTCLILSSEGGFAGEAALYKYCNEEPAFTVLHDLHDIIIFPNPADEYLNIKNDFITTKGFIQIENQFGQVILGPIKYSGELTGIDISHLSSGVYFVTSVIQNEILKTTLIIQ